MRYDYDIIVIGAGHAGCEAAHAAATMSARTLLITIDIDRIAQMSCNPAVGGIAKGQIVREIDALGGMMGIVTDASSLQFRMLNRSKGAAMWSPRSQCDRRTFSTVWRHILEGTPGLNLWQDTVTSLDICDGQMKGVNTGNGTHFTASKVILTAGTFLGGLMHIGRQQIPGGRAAEPAVGGLTAQLAVAGLRTNRMKTGTPVRIDGRSVRWEETARQDGDNDWHRFSYLPREQWQHLMPLTWRKLPQLPCHILYTNEATHEVLRRGLPDSPLYNGQIQSIGPRYCPSIETKIVTFADRTSHQLFLEPEDADGCEYYLNGFSSSLPLDIQVEALHTIPALKDVHIFRPGYAIEYDFFDPTQLHHTLESRVIEGLYLAGQVNGTTGYEEAAGQGLVAGVNAALSVQGREPWHLHRDQAYIGVLIDDLVNKGVDEPYRMFTSRAEHRILLRQDDADLRLTPIANELGLVDEGRMQRVETKQKELDGLLQYLSSTIATPMEVEALLEGAGTPQIRENTRLHTLLLRPQLTLETMATYLPSLQHRLEAIPPTLRQEVAEAAEIAVKYEGYVQRERQVAYKLRRLDDIQLRPDFDYNAIDALSTEARQKLTLHRPTTIGDASRIPGVSPADINTLLIILGR